MHNEIRQEVQARLMRQTHSAANVWMIVICFVTFFLHTAGTRTLDSHGFPEIGTNRASVSITWLILIGMLILHNLLMAVAPRVAKRPAGQWGLIFLKALVTVGAGWLIGFGQIVLYIGMLPLMMIESLNLFRRRWIAAAVFLTCYVLLVLYAMTGGLINGFFVAQGELFTSLIVFFYWREYSQQVDAREEAENLLAELQLAYQQVEESSVRNERQRVARELHDTLTQGLAGVIMQLEAADSLLEQGKTERGDEIVKSSIQVARKTLQDSRLTLTDLRSSNEANLTERLQLLQEAFQKNYDLAVTLKVVDVPELSPDVVTQLIRSVSECLMNVVKHAQTKTVVIHGRQHQQQFELQVVDFGVGFKANNVKKVTGHYGLTGLKERLAGIGGTVTIDSAVNEGTMVTLALPLPKGTQNAN